MGIDKLPNEVLIEIVAELYNPEAPIPPGTDQRTEYRDLLNFCKLNKKCSKVGQEILFRHCNLTEDPVLQTCLLLRTLLESGKDTLRMKVRSLSLNLHRQKPVFLNGRNFMRYGTDSLIARIAEHIHGSDLEDATKEEWKSEIGALNLKFWFFALISLAPNLQRLESRNMSVDYIDSSFNDCEDLVQGVQVMQAFGLLKKLDYFSVGDSIDFHTFQSIPYALKSPPLRTLEIIPFGIRSVWNRTRTIEKLKTPHALSDVETLKVGSQFPLHLCDIFFAFFQALRTLHISVETQDRDHELWLGLPIVKDSLEHLKIFCTHGKPDPWGWGEDLNSREHNKSLWPRNLDQLHKLKVLEFGGGIEFDIAKADATFQSSVLFSTSRKGRDLTIAEAFFPPNIEEIIFTPDRIATKDVLLLKKINAKKQLTRDKFILTPRQQQRRLDGKRMPISRPLYTFLENVTNRRPRLKSVTVTSSLWKPYHYITLQQQLAKNSVTLKMKSMREEREELWGVWGEWRTPDLWSLDCSGVLPRDIRLSDEDGHPKILDDLEVLDMKRAKVLKELASRGPRHEKQAELDAESILPDLGNLW